MRRIVECVPNISEGRDQSVIDAVLAAAKVDGVEILDVDAGAATNRTVITLVGGPEEILEGAFRLIAKAAELIDMRTHKGEHPRMGATDVCPFIPIEGISMEECAELAKRLGERVGTELGIPVYLYEAAASSPERRSLAYLRQGEYEGLSAKLKAPKMQPDFGEAKFNPRSGATVIGARPILIAYNINLNSKNKQKANKIAFKLRESGFKKRDETGKFVFDGAGNPVIEPGLFPHCRAVGWYIEEFGIAQVSINLTDYTITPIHAVFDAAVKLADELGLRVTGSEIVGLVPKQALLQSGRHYLKKQGATTAIPDSEIMKLAIQSLGLNDLYKFETEKKLIEERVRQVTLLASLSVEQFVDLLSTDAPAPGGGSVSALSGALSAGLCSMVSSLTFGKLSEKKRKTRTELERKGNKAQSLKARLVTAIDRDTEAFNKVIAAFRIKADSENEAKARHAKILEAYTHATQVPLEVATDCLSALRLSLWTLQNGIETAKSDSAVALKMAYSGFKGASYNVNINLKELKRLNKNDSGVNNFIAETQSSLGKLSDQAERILAEGNTLIEASL